jgi:hypothetical protein
MDGAKRIHGSENFIIINIILIPFMKYRGLCQQKNGLPTPLSPLEIGELEKNSTEGGEGPSRCPGKGEIHAAKTGGRWRAEEHFPGFR